MSNLKLNDSLFEDYCEPKNEEVEDKKVIENELEMMR
jgi:hypothetical protein